MDNIPLKDEGEKELLAGLTEKIIDRIRDVRDPEIPVNVYDLGLIYAIEIRPASDGKLHAAIAMTLTAPGCPVADTLPLMVRDAVADVPELAEVTVDLVWDPPWDKSRLSDEALLELGLF
ncbi:MAG: DUF59 domain-containing protein [Alphaproteobacteria bacterium]|nr:DUF59 domain-containing protein [Alphaproteobacteria bacterium]